MIALEKACLFLLFTSGALAAAVSDTVNERIPVSEAELEAHWRVDCSGVSNRLRETMGRSKAGEGCHPAPALRHQLQLCAFIYQAPGSGTPHACPDYRSALEALDRAGPDDDCRYITKFLPDPERCPSPDDAD